MISSGNSGKIELRAKSSFTYPFRFSSSIVTIWETGGSPPSSPLPPRPHSADPTLQPSASPKTSIFYALPRTLASSSTALFSKSPSGGGGMVRCTSDAQGDKGGRGPGLG